VGSASENILRSLVVKANMDPDCLSYESASYRRSGEDEILWSYFGARLMELYEEVENPTPRGSIKKWVQSHSHERHIMFATLIGIIVAILLGIAGLGVGIFQAWVSYEAWKYPVRGEA
jgi:hypothetical protein